MSGVSYSKSHEIEDFPDLTISLKPGRATVPAFHDGGCKQSPRRFGKELLSVCSLVQLRFVLRDDHVTEITTADIRRLRCIRDGKDHLVLARGCQYLTLQPLEPFGKFVRYRRRQRNRRDYISTIMYSLCRSWRSWLGRRSVANRN